MAFLTGHDASVVVDYSIEIAHVYGAHHLDVAGLYEIEESVRIGCEQIQNLKAQGKTYSICVMIDDQKTSNVPRVEFEAFLRYLGGLIEIDYVCYETDLRAKFPDLLDTLNNPRPIQKEVDERYAGQPQCSHFIGIWYMMRLGYIDPTGCIIPVSESAKSGQRPFVGKQIISVLSDQHQVNEQRAERSLLLRSKHRDMVQRVARLYYPVYQPELAEGLQSVAADIVPSWER